MAATFKILAFEDVSSNSTWAAGLSRSEFELLSLSTGEQFTLPTHYAPDAIILNMSDRGSDGLRLCRMLRGEARFADVPILFLDDGRGNQAQWDAFEAGGSDYLAQPVDGAHLREKLTLSLARAKVPRPAASNDPPGLEQPLQLLHEGLIRLALVNGAAEVLEQTHKTLKELGLAGAVRHHQSGKTISSVGPLTDLEASLLQQAHAPYPLDHSARLLWGSAAVAVLIHNMPHPDGPHYNATRQMVLTLCNAATRKLDHLQRSAPATLSAGWRAEIDVLAVKVEYALAELGSSSERKLNELGRKVDHLATDLGYLQNQRQRFKALELACTDVRLGLFDQYLEVESHLGRLLSALHRAADGVAAPPPAAGGHRGKGVK